MKITQSLKVLLCLLLLISVHNAWAAPPAHAKGSPPTKTYWLDFFGEAGEFTFDFVDCGAFQTTLTVQLTGFWITHTGHPKRDTWEFYHSAVPTRVANALDESLYVDSVPGTSLNRLWLDGPFQGDAIETGVQLMVTLPGYGVVARNVGRIVYEWPPGSSPVKFLAGKWDSQSGDFQALCDALSW